ncbi:MAG: YdbL family protein [Tistlia sp.]|uniref:YdbL family protein n=1 Tax=Tistlia sp. TaxID=3057121 RepID=UPI0034A232CD
MMSRRFFLTALAAGGLCATLLGPVLTGAGTAWAQTPEDLLRAGTAGERWDGFMEARDGSAAATVEAINDKRRNVYVRRAGEQGVPSEEVAKVYAQEIIAKAPSGSWIKRQDGSWVQK